MDLPDDVTDVQRLRLEPGDALVIRLQSAASVQRADVIRQWVRAVLKLDESTPVLVLPDGMAVEVLDDETKIREAMARAQDHPGRIITR